MNTIYLYLASLISAFGLGYSKFFGLGYLAETVYQAEDKVWIIQLIGAIMTIGPALAYFVSAPLAAAYKKQQVMLAAALFTTATLIVGHFTHWIGSPWLYLFVIGFAMGVYSVAKMSAIPIQALQSGQSTTKINAGMSIFFIIGILTGIYFGALSFEKSKLAGTVIGIAIFGLSAVPASLCRFKSEHLVTFSQANSQLFANTLSLLFRYPLHLFSTPLIWGSAGALSLAVTAYAEHRSLGDSTACSLMSLYAALGTILGNLLSNWLTQARHRAALVTASMFLFACLLIPIVVESSQGHLSPDTLYWVVSLLMLTAGCFFGCSTNLIDAELLELCAQDKLEGPGAALQSVMISIFSFLLGGTIGLSILGGWLDATTQFIVLTLLTAPALVLLAILAFKKGQLDHLLIPALTKAINFGLRRRYSIHIEGEELLQGQRKGYLILPNHPAEVDPVLLYILLHRSFSPRPVVIEDFYHMPFVHHIMKMIRAFPMPDLESGAGAYKKRRIDATLRQLAQDLDQGDNILIYPSGRLMRTGLEKLGATSGTFQLIANVPDANVLLVRTRGLWGSSFSTVKSNGQRPDLAKSIWQGIKILILNGILFCPKRKVVITLQEGKAFNAFQDPLKLNQHLESFYNDQGEEALQNTPNYFWRSNEPASAIQKSEPPHHPRPPIPEAQQESILSAFAQSFNYKRDQLTPESRLAEDLGMDSITKAELMAWLDEQYEINDVEMSELHQLADVLVLAAGLGKANEASKPTAILEGWVEQNRPAPLQPSAKTIHAAFLDTCQRMGTANALVDPNSGMLSYRQLKIGAILMARYLKKHPEKHIGIMLPASGAAALAVMGTLLANKVPVMLNWTVGRRNLEHAVQITELKTVITSSTFLDKLEQADFGELENQFLMLEDLKAKQFGLGEKIVAMAMARKSTPHIIDSLDLSSIAAEDPAVILFTSGSESAPKGVPLSHQNILCNVSDALDVMTFDEKDCLFGFLPPFHSFGFTVTTIMPLVSGLKMATHPNPNESRRIASGSAKYAITRICGTPTFLQAIVKAARPHQLDHIKSFVTGAEKCPPHFFESVEALNTQAEVLEGYGITECSPVLSINRPKQKSIGVGTPFPSVHILIVDIDTLSPLPHGQRGLILARGENIFHGYLGTDQNPFVEVDGHRWYNTGDLGILDEEGHLILAGRMKRFVKVAGEMISLPAMEIALLEKWPSTDDGPTLAIEAREIDGRRPVFTLFSTQDIGLDEANEALIQAGFTSISKLAHSIQLDTMPILGTGKTDIQSLKKLLPE